MRFCKLTDKKGFTLAEISIVIVLIALLATLALSILILVDGRQKDATNEVNAENELYSLETAYKDWLGSYDSFRFEIIVSEGGDTLTAQSDDQTLTMTFAEGKLAYDYEGESKVLIFDDISGVKFELCADDIIRCTAVKSGKEYKILYHIRAAKL